MLDHTGPMMVCDFGLSQFFQCNSEKLETSKLIRGKHQGIRFIPPELIEDYLKGKYHLASIETHKKADIWAAGVTLYRLITREFPIKASGVMDLKT